MNDDRPSPSEIADLLRELKSGQSMQTGQLAAINAAHRTMADEVSALGNRMRRAEENIRLTALANSEAQVERDNLQRALLTHVDRVQTNISSELDALRRNDSKQNQELTQQTSKLDLLLDADRERREREKIIAELAALTQKRVEGWKARVEIGSGVLGILSLLAATLMWLISHR